MEMYHDLRLNLCQTHDDDDALFADDKGNQMVSTQVSFLKH